MDSSKILIIIFITASLLLISCDNNSVKRIVSETPIKTEVLGLTLCEKSSEKAIKKAISKATDNQVITNKEKVGSATSVSVFPYYLQLNYGGLSWHYVNVTLNEDLKITEIDLIASFENIERAKEQFTTASNVFNQKYGNGNASEEDHNIFWTDDTNSVGLTYMESSAINGNDRSFCYLYYVNIELSDALEKANTPDV
ncbi:MAG: hypothetical protein IKR69_02000 [Bacteroidales bacterium]|nr:hypothetical protein [Bacteroidales bacterium]